MKINRQWAMPNSKTFTIKPIKELVERYTSVRRGNIQIECYEGVGIKVTAEHTKSSWRAKHLDEIKRIVKPNGLVLSFGWNTNGVGKTRGFEIIEILIVAHGGSKNDTLVTVEKKVSN